MSTSLDAAVSGMVEQQRNLELISNNLANVNTPGYKRLSVHFQDVLSDAVAGDNTGGGSGVRTSAATRSFGQGSLTPTGRDLDFAISGDGFFKVKLEDGTAGYTRDGTFFVGVDGRLTTANGYILDPSITVPLVYSDLKVDGEGNVSVRRPLTDAEMAALKPGEPRDGKRETIGQFKLVRFPNPVGLTSVGQSIFVETEASQAPIEGTTGVEGMGSVYAGWLESSNVDIALEMSNLSLASRSYALSFTAFKTIEEMLRQAGQVTT